MNHEEIVHKIGRIKEPESGQSLNQRGMIKSIQETSENTIQICIQHLGDHYPFKSKLENAIRQSLEADLPEKHVEFLYSKKPTQPITELISLPSIKHIVLVASGKGGVGKSTTSAYLALALSKLGLKVGLMDADAYGPNIPHIFDCKSAPYQANDKIIPVQTHGIKMISLGLLVPPEQAIIWRGPMLHKLIRQFLQDVEWGELDTLVIDLPPGTGDVQLSIIHSIPVATAILVTTPQTLSVADVRKAVGMFRQVNIDIMGIVENMSYYQCKHCDSKEYIFGEDGGSRLAQELDIPLLDKMPIDSIFSKTISDQGCDFYLPLAKKLKDKLLGNDVH